MTLRTAIAEFWLRNASLRHGHPSELLKLAEEAAPAAASKLMPLVLTGLLSAAGAGGLATWLLGSAATSSPAPPAATTPAPTASNAEPSAGSLYQFLEDHDLHLPE